MWPERGAASNLTGRASVERLTAILLTIAADQDVRVLEALAAALVNGSDQPGADGEFGLGESEPAGFVGQGTAGDVERKLELGRRVARRALRGSLVDPTSGATAFHRIEANPVWARDLLPVAVIGSFLFYKGRA